MPALVSAQGDRAVGETSVIRAIDITRVAVFDSVEARFWGYRLMNALHAETRAYVVRRELLFRAGEPFDTARANETERNLRSLGLFRDVEIDTVRTDSGLVARVRTVDAWTTTVGFGLSTSGRQSVYSLSLNESNFLGSGTIAALSYVNDVDRSAILAGFDAPRLVAQRVGVGATYLDRSDGQAGSLSVRYPFVSLSSRQGASLSAQYSEGRVLRFVGGRARAADSLRRRFEIVRGEAARATMASPRGFVRVGVAGQLRREDYAPKSDTAPLARTVTAALGPLLSVRVPRFIQVRNVNTIGRVEDVDLGLQLRAGLLIAPSSWGYARDGIGTSLGVAVGQRIPGGYAQAQAGASALATVYGTDSASAHVSGTAYMQRGDRHLLVAHAVAAALKNPHPGGEFDLGLGDLLRAYPAHAFTGDRLYALSAEYRWIALPRFLGLVGVGAATFVDHAGAWFAGSPRRSGTEVGTGLRFASIREAAVVWRLDLSYRLANDVHTAGRVVSLGRGFVF